MARPIKDGVDYFPKDADFYSDDKVRLLRAEFGAKGMYLLDYILCEIYGKEGYYLPWDKNRCFLVSDGAGCGCGPDLVEQVIAGCIRCSFFDERVAESFGVLTSAGIQKRYVRMFGSRDFLNIEGRYFLLDVEDVKDVPGSVIPKLTLFYESTENPYKSRENLVRKQGNRQIKVEVTNVTQNRVKVTFVTQRENESEGLPRQQHFINDSNKARAREEITENISDAKERHYEELIKAYESSKEKNIPVAEIGSFLNSAEMKLYRIVVSEFKERGVLGDPNDFIAYNEARSWRGLGGESVIENLGKYIEKWGESEERRSGNTEGVY